MVCRSFLNYRATYRCAVFAEMGSCNFSKIIQSNVLFFCLQTFKAAFLWCVGVRTSQFRYLCKVVSKNRSVRSCALTFANCIRRSFSKKANQTRENSGTNHINPPSKRSSSLVHCHWNFGPGKIGLGGPNLPWKFWSSGPKLREGPLISDGS